eukprot:Protomagalhaensia_wolfi_Nauph_80__6223@NODE_935_length_1870_cov_19_373020_g706_i0_p2_GENE_NODE_935_length_1870_cov_19_373020_g706_i0NODE_935_length_1870_cov_19_373020_g706_i0_p2_ORF_typecomplete_len157_score25_42TMEM18/PF14770_6/4_8e21DUF3093/PF11292_8/27DUF3093/PF11292_8/12_NODE_935_length_1870_cov_19_373020_g706_i0143613
MGSVLHNTAERLLSHMTNEPSPGGSLVEDFLVFANDIEWTHWFFSVLLVVHLLYLTIVVLVVQKGHTGFIITLAAVAFLATRLAERINHFFATEKRWQTVLGFQKNYFQDSSGAFISLVWSTPFVLSSFLSVILLLIKLSGLVVAVKRRELKMKKA